jgi:hypothetical protein
MDTKDANATARRTRMTAPAAAKIGKRQLPPELRSILRTLNEPLLLSQIAEIEDYPEAVIEQRVAQLIRHGHIVKVRRGNQTRYVAADANQKIARKPISQEASEAYRELGSTFTIETKPIIAAMPLEAAVLEKDLLGPTGLTPKVLHDRLVSMEREGLIAFLGVSPTILVCLTQAARHLPEALRSRHKAPAFEPFAFLNLPGVILAIDRMGAASARQLAPIMSTSLAQMHAYLRGLANAQYLDSATKTLRRPPYRLAPKGQRLADQLRDYIDIPTAAKLKRAALQDPPTPRLAAPAAAAALPTRPATIRPMQPTGINAPKPIVRKREEPAARATRASLSRRQMHDLAKAVIDALPETAIAAVAQAIILFFAQIETAPKTPDPQPSIKRAAATMPAPTPTIVIGDCVHYAFVGEPQNHRQVTISKDRHDPEQKIIASSRCLARAMLGAEVGETVSFVDGGREREIFIIEINKHS